MTKIEQLRSAMVDRWNTDDYDKDDIMRFLIDIVDCMISDSPPPDSQIEIDHDTIEESPYHRSYFKEQDSQQGDVCPECFGHKVTDYAGVVQLCPECNGTGVIYDVFTDTERECKCNGTGRETK